MSALLPALAIFLSLFLIEPSSAETSREKFDEYRAECTANVAKGCVGLGVAYLIGVSGTAERSDTAAAEYFRKACDLKFGDGCFFLSERYREGKGVERSQARAAELAEASCTMNHGDGCSMTGLYYLEGIGVEVSKPKAAELFKKACDLNSGPACQYLAKSLPGYGGARGFWRFLWGAKKADEEVLALLKKSCDLGWEEGCEDYGSLK